MQLEVTITTGRIRGRERHGVALFAGIAQRGAGHHTIETDVAVEVGERLLMELAAGDVEAARTCSAADVLEAQARVAVQAGAFMNAVVGPFYPSPDGEHLVRRPVDVMEIPFAFNTLAAPGVDVFLGPGELPEALAGVMHHCWIEFIRSGSPGHGDIPDWQPYDAVTRTVLKFADELRALVDPAASTREAWDGLR